jgi:t-SNARE complex subunit (syntaxin)
MRGGYQELATKESMTFEMLGEKLAQLDAAKGRAERELAGLRSRRGSIERLEKDKDALLDLLESLADMVPEALDGLAPE